MLQQVPYTRVGVVQAMSLTHKWDDSLAQKVREEEEKVDKYEDALGTYLVKLSSREMSHAIPEAPHIRQAVSHF